MSLKQERAAWGVSIPRTFTREEKKLWTKDEKAMYRAFELHGKDQALKLMRSYFARKKSEGGDEDTDEEQKVCMTISLLGPSESFKNDEDSAKTSDQTKNTFGEEEQEKFKEIIASISGVDKSAVTITKTSDTASTDEEKRLQICFEVVPLDENEDENEDDSPKRRSAEDIAAKLNDKKAFQTKLAEKGFTGLAIVNAAEVIGGARAAKKARKSIMNELYGKSKNGEGEKPKDADH